MAFTHDMNHRARPSFMISKLLDCEPVANFRLLPAKPATTRSAVEQEIDADQRRFVFECYYPRLSPLLVSKPNNNCSPVNVDPQPQRKGIRACWCTPELACRVGSVRKRYRFQPRTATRRSPEVVFHHVIRSDPLKLRRPAHKLQPSLQGRNRG